MSQRLFISYAHEDRGIAESLAEGLKKRGYSVWWDYELVGGRQFRTEIGRELDNADQVLALWSPSSVDSRWVKAEAARAADRGTLIEAAIANLDLTAMPESSRSLPIVEIGDERADLDRLIAVLRRDERQIRLERERNERWRRLGPVNSSSALRAFGEQGLLSPSLGYSAVAFSPDGRTLACGSGLGDVALWDTATGAELQKFGGLGRSFKKYRTLAGLLRASGDTGGKMPPKITCLAWFPDGSTLVSGGWDSTVRLWDAAGARLRRKLEGHPSWVQDLDVSPDGRLIVSAGTDRMEEITEADGTVTLNRVAAGLDRTLIVWEAATGRVLRRPGEDRLPVTAVRFSPDGSRIAAGHVGPIKIWDAATGEERAALPVEGDGVFSLAFSAGGSRLLAGGTEGVTLWDLESSSIVRRMRGHYQAVSVAFSRDERAALSAGNEGSVKLWDLESGHLIRTYLGHEGSVEDLSVAPDGATLVTACQDGKMRLFEVPHF